MRPTEKSSRTALILAAGVGSRLFPVTVHTPKPLVPFFGVPTLEFAAYQLVAAGVNRIAVNVFHLADQVQHFVMTDLATRFPDVQWRISAESALAGTGGAVHLLKDWLQLDPGGFWLANSDAIHTADLGAMAKQHLVREADATMLVTSTSSYDVVRNVIVSPDGHFLGLSPKPDGGGTDADKAAAAPKGRLVAYCGWMLAKPALANVLPSTTPSCSIRQGLIPWRRQGARVSTYETPQFSADLGTPERYLRAHLDGVCALPSFEAVGLFGP